MVQLNVSPVKLASGRDERAVRVPVVVGDVVAEGGSDPEPGDVKYMDLCDSVTHTESRGPYTVGAVAGPARAKSYRRVWREYDDLLDDGNESGQETYTDVVRSEYYGMKDCSAAYLGNANPRYEFALTWKAYPLP